MRLSKGGALMSIASLRRKRGAFLASYPRQFWLLVGGTFVNQAAFSMLWPFLTLYMTQVMDVRLTTVSLLLTVRSITSILSTVLVSPWVDRLGRKGAMAASLTGSALVFLAMSVGSGRLDVWVILLAAYGFTLPIFNIGVNAMVTDLVGEERRAPAFALIRASFNAGIAIGPIIGGLMAVISFSFVFQATALVYLLLVPFCLLLLHETNPDDALAINRFAGGYGYILRDPLFLALLSIYLLLAMAFSQVFTLLPVYLADQFRFAESQFGLLFTVNALLVVLFQVSITRATRDYPPYVVLAAGAAFYAIGITSITQGSLLVHFLLSMGVLTIGELLVSPTATTLVANMAPRDMRARYLGLLALSYPVGGGLGPIFGGFLHDAIAPVAMWYGAGSLAVASLVGFLLLSRWHTQAATTTAASHGSDI